MKDRPVKRREPEQSFPAIRRRKSKNSMNRNRLAGIATAAAGAVAAYAFAIRPWHLRWGATDEEASAEMPGDFLTRDPVKQSTHAVTIHASAAEVWPWLAQIGQKRAGFYSYDWLENLVGCRMRNAERIVPEWQGIAVGDKIWLHPNAPPIPVALVEPEKALVLGSSSGATGTWGFALVEIDRRITRLIARSRASSHAMSLPAKLGYCILFEPAHYIMERKMLLNIKRLAERGATQFRTELTANGGD